MATELSEDCARRRIGGSVCDGITERDAIIERLTEALKWMIENYAPDDEFLHETVEGSEMVNPFDEMIAAICEDERWDEAEAHAIGELVAALTEGSRDA